MESQRIIREINSVRELLTPHGLIAWAILMAAYVLTAAIREKK